MAKNQKEVGSTASVKACKLISRANFPITISYGKLSIVISPKQRVTVADESLLGELPSNITKIEIGETK